MKRSSAITLAVLGALALSGCSEEQKPPTQYTSVAECTADGIAQETCQKSFDEAQKAAPKFSSMEQCQAQFSNCQQSSSGDWIMPAMAGYLVGSMMNNGSRGYAQPVYIDRDRRPVTSSYSGGVYRTTPSTTPSYQTRQTQARAAAASRSSATTSSRGGFGSRSSSSSSFGG